MTTGISASGLAYQPASDEIKTKTVLLSETDKKMQNVYPEPFKTLQQSPEIYKTFSKRRIFYAAMSFTGAALIGISIKLLTSATKAKGAFSLLFTLGGLMIFDGIRGLRDLRSIARSYNSYARYYPLTEKVRDLCSAMPQLVETVKDNPESMSALQSKLDAVKLELSELKKGGELNHDVKYKIKSRFESVERLLNALKDETEQKKIEPRCEIVKRYAQSLKQGCAELNMTITHVKREYMKGITNGWR